MVYKCTCYPVYTVWATNRGQRREREAERVRAQHATTGCERRIGEVRLLPYTVHSRRARTQQQTSEISADGGTEGLPKSKSHIIHITSREVPRYTILYLNASDDLRFSFENSRGSSRPPVAGGRRPAALHKRRRCARVRRWGACAALVTREKRRASSRNADAASSSLSGGKRDGFCVYQVP